MKNFIILPFCFIASLALSQEVSSTILTTVKDSTVLKKDVSSTLNSSLPDLTAYIVNGSFIPAKNLMNISQDSIKSMNVIKKDTVINNQKYKAQIFIILKSKED